MNDDFDSIVRTALRDVSDRTHPDADLADRLIGNTRAGGNRITPLRRVRRGSAWTLPLLAAAAVAVVATGVVVGQQALSDTTNPATHHTPTPTVSHVLSPSAPTTSPTSATSTAPKVTDTVAAGFRAAEVSFDTARDGWAIGARPCATTPKLGCATVEHTVDGGRVWHRVRPPSGLISPFVADGSCGGDGDITGRCANHVLFADARHGFLWGYHQFYATSDGGATWQRDSGGTYVFDLAVGNGYAVRLRSTQPCSSGCGGYVERADLGSTTWTRTSTVQAGQNASSVAARGNTVVVAASSFYAQPKNVVIMSTDGGRNWTSVATTPCGTHGFFHGVLIGFDGTVALSCGLGDTVQVRTIVGGGNRFGPARALLTGQARYPDLVAVVDRLTYVVVDDFGAGSTPAALPVWVSSDGPSPYRRTATLSTTSTPRFVTARVGYVPTEDGRRLAVTTDSGLTWHEQSFG